MSLTSRQIIEIHDTIFKKYGGTGGVLNEGTLELLVYKASREKDIFRQAALILHTIAVQHPFFDGNKRTLLQRQRTPSESQGTTCMLMTKR